MNQRLTGQIRQTLTGQTLKMIAVISMTIDHCGAVLFPGMIWMRCVGRLAFVLYAFLITEGYLHTRNVRRYLLRLLLLAVISEIPFDLLFYGQPFYPWSQNVYITLFLGLLAIWLMDGALKRSQTYGWLLSLLPLALCSIAAQVLCSDYGCWGIWMIAAFYALRYQTVLKYTILAILQMMMGTIQTFGIAALVPIHFYNGQRGKDGNVQKWIFYLYYPAHMLVIYVAANLLPL